MRKLLLLLLFLGLIGAAAAHYFVRMDSYAGFTAPVYVEIPRGTSTLRIGDLLAEAGVIRHAYLYPLARLTRPGAVSQAGEYEFSRPATPGQVFARIARGDIYTVELRVPEGSNIWDTAALVEQAGFGSAEEFLRVARSSALVREIVPGAPSLEGYLFPSTYRFPRKSRAEQVARTMTRQFRKVWEELGASAPIHETVTLASLVETEAKVPEDRGLIAGVYRNRLAKGMKLECDPTVIYAAIIAGKWRGTIHRSDLDRQSPYNTYRQSGLPPGPIANPGREALRAVLHPARTEALFFVVQPGGGGAHVFSKDLKAHQRAVDAYRRDEQKNTRKAAGSAVAAKPAPRTRH
jgi:UPF0755 protein